MKCTLQGSFRYLFSTDAKNKKVLVAKRVEVYSFVPGQHLHITNRCAAPLILFRGWQPMAYRSNLTHQAVLSSLQSGGFGSNVGTGGIGGSVLLTSGSLLLEQAALIWPTTAKPLIPENFGL